MDRSTTVGMRRNDCAVSFTTTADGGRTWSPPHGPTPWRDCQRSKDPATAFDVLGLSVYSATVDDATYLSRDAGATWQRWEPKVVAVDGFPVGARPRECLGGCADNAFATVDPVSGDLNQLRTLPPLTSRWMMRVAPDDTLWVAGSNADKSAGHSQAPAVVRSVDRGRTWSATAALPTDLADVVVVAATAQEAYVFGARGNAEFVYHTTDGGQTWNGHEAAGLYAGGGTPCVVVGDNSELIVGSIPAAGSAVWVSVDHGQTFAQQPQPPREDTGWFSAGTGVLWREQPYGGPTILTTDGRTWLTINPPA